MTSPADFEVIINVLVRHNVKFIVVGGISAVLQGAPVSTFDLDVVPEQDADNIHALEAALAELSATYRERPGLSPTYEHLVSGGHFLLDTDAGALDVLTFIGNGRTYQELQKHTIPIKFTDSNIAILDLPTLISTKEECGREKDMAMLPLLRSTLREIENKGNI